MNKNDIGKFIRDKRTERSLSQTDLAEKANLSYRRILDIEKDHRNYSIEVVIDILRVLGYEMAFVPIQSITIDGMKYKFKSILPAKEGDKNEKEFTSQNTLK
jgi:y4mF family transcriptional regulator